MENKVFAILKKISKEQITELSVKSDLQDWLDINLVAGEEFNKITDLESAMNQVEISLGGFLRDREAFENAYENMKNFDVGDFQDRRMRGDLLLDDYENLAEELGIEASGSPEFSDVLTQVTEIYPDFIDKLSRAYSEADILVEDLNQYGITIN